MRPFTALYHWVLVLLTPFIFCAIELSELETGSRMCQSLISSFLTFTTLAQLDGQRAKRGVRSATHSPKHQKNHGTLSYTLRWHSGQRLSASSAYRGEDVRLASERVTKLTCACFTCAIMSNNANNARRKEKKPILDIGFSICQPF